jgi:sugar/nucleoside kinase (ribokinase family)
MNVRIKKLRGPMIGVGSPVVDQIARVPENFLKTVGGEKGGMELVDAETLERLLASVPEKPLFAPGGSAGNTAFAMAHLGVPSRFLGAVGADEPGAFYRNTFQTIGGDDRAFRIRENLPTAQCLSLVTPDGERTMRTHLGAAMTLAPEHVTPEAFAGCVHAHVEGYLLFNPDLMRHVLAAAKSAGCTVSVDLASFEVVEASHTLLPELLSEFVDIVFANEEEAEAFAGTANPEACRDALGQFCNTVAVKIGAEGALLLRDGETCRVPAMPVEKVVDTTGAGDLWAAGFLYGILNDYPLEKCGICGAALGAAVVTLEGATLPENVWNRLRETVAA